MPRFAIRLEYDGTPYMGWQYQEHGPSVQGAVIDAFREFTGETLTVHASGRTDAGVRGRALEGGSLELGGGAGAGNGAPWGDSSPEASVSAATVAARAWSATWPPGQSTESVGT